MTDLVIINKIKYPVKIAVTPEEQSYGLMNCLVPTIMAFPSKKNYKSFWMKDTPMPLDLIFACDGAIVDIQQGVPYSLDHIESKHLSDLVVEFPQGILNHFPINLGDKIELQYSIKSIAKKYDLTIRKQGAL